MSSLSHLVWMRKWKIILKLAMLLKQVVQVHTVMFFEALLTLLDHLHPPYSLDVRPSHEFSYDSAVRKLADLDLEIFQEAQAMLVVPGYDDPAVNYARGLEPGLSHVQGNILHLSSAIDLESRLSVSCVGAVLSYIQRRRAVVYLPGDPTAVEMFKVTYLETFSLTNVM